MERYDLNTYVDDSVTQTLEKTLQNRLLTEDKKSYFFISKRQTGLYSEMLPWYYQHKQ